MRSWCSYFITFIHRPDEVNNEAEDVAYEEIGFGMEEELEEDDVTDFVDAGPGVIKIQSDTECENLCDSISCISYVDQLKILAKTSITKCTEQDCDSPINLEEEFVGSALYIKWVNLNLMLKL